MLDDLRKTIEATIGDLTPARAKSLAKSLAGPGAAKEQVAKSAADLIDWSQKNRDRLKGFIRREVSSQVGAVGVASQTELEALKKRVRVLERSAEKRRTSSSDSTGKGAGTATKAGSKTGARTGAASGTPKTGAKSPAKRTTGGARARG